MAIEKINAMVADYSFDVKNIDIWAPAFFKHNNSFIATVCGSPSSQPGLSLTYSHHTNNAQ